MKKTVKNCAYNRYVQKALTAFTFKYHNVNDKEIIEKLNSVENKADYIRQLILKDIRGE